MNTMLKGLVVAAVFAAAFSGAVQARPANSHSIKYFDANGTVIGQRYLLCDGRSGHGGTVASAYFVEEVTVCGAPGTPPDEGWISPSYIVTNAFLAPGWNLDSACGVAHCGGQFVPEVEIYGGWTYTPGWQ